MKTGIRQALWMAAGAAVLLGVLLVVLHFSGEVDPSARLASKATRADLVGRMQVALTSSSEAEKSAVMAVTDETSRKFADESRAATAAVERRRGELAERLKTDGTQEERELLDRFSQAFSEQRRVDDEVLALAVANSNLHAYALAFGPAADAIEEMNAALSRVVTSHEGSPDAVQITRLGLGAQVAALRIQALLAPHIAEETNPKMDDLESRMAAQDEAARAALAGLSALAALQGDADLAKAASSYARFAEIRGRILKLSRENTNVRSLVISLDRKRKAMLACLDALSALQDAILAEPIPGVTYGRPVSPR
jgi:hypothetical protein